MAGQQRCWSSKGLPSRCLVIWNLRWRFLHCYDVFLKSICLSYRDWIQQWVELKMIELETIYWYLIGILEALPEDLPPISPSKWFNFWGMNSGALGGSKIWVSCKYEVTCGKVHMITDGWCEWLNGVNRFSNLSRIIGAFGFCKFIVNLETNSGGIWIRWFAQVPQKMSSVCHFCAQHCGGSPKLHSEVDLIISSRSICWGLQFGSNISRFALVCQLWFLVRNLCLPERWW